MAFMLGNRMIEKVLAGYAEDSDNKFLYLLDNLADTVINITAEANEHKDADGNLVKKSYKNKSGTLEAKNAWVNTNIVAATAGGATTFASTTAKIKAPKIVILPANTTELDLVAGADPETIHVSSLGTGVALTKHTGSETQKAGEFAVDTEANKIKFLEGEGQLVVKYDRSVEEGALIVNKSDKFPTSCKLTLKVAYWDTCDKDTLKGCYVVIPSFQVSPEISLPLNAETQMDYKGDLETDYCGGEKVLYKFFDVADNEE